LELLTVFVLGLALGSVLGYLLAMPRVWRLETELAQKKEKALGQDLPQHQNSYWRFEGPKLQKKVQELESELKWKQAKILALELDLERAQSKWMWKE
jgi:hypothetical protein